MERDFSFSEQKSIFVIGIVVGIFGIVAFLLVSLLPSGISSWKFDLFKAIAILVFASLEIAILGMSRIFRGKVVFNEDGISVIAKNNKILRFIMWKDVCICNVSTNANTFDKFICISSNKKIKKDHLYWPGVAVSPIYYKDTISLPTDIQVNLWYNLNVQRENVKC